MRDINSYCADRYASLAAALFLHVDSQFYMVKFKNQYIGICDKTILS